MAQGLGAFAVLTEDAGLVPSTHMELQLPVALVPRDPNLHRWPTCTWYVYIQACKALLQDT